MRILVFGRVGQLGTALVELLGPLHETVFLDQPEIDLSKPDSVFAHVHEHAPDLVVNAAAYTAVDKAETEPDLADAINARAPVPRFRWCIIQRTMSLMAARQLRTARVHRSARKACTGGANSRVSRR